MFEEGTDVLVFIYSTHIEDETQRMVAAKFNELAMKFK